MLILGDESNSALKKTEFSGAEKNNTPNPSCHPSHEFLGFGSGNSFITPLASHPHIYLKVKPTILKIAYPEIVDEINAY